MTKRLVRWQRIGVKACPSPPGYYEASPYWQHYHRQHKGDIENKLANPDVLDSQQTLWPSKHTSTELEIIQELTNLDFSKLLTPQESKLIKLIVHQNKSFREISSALGLSTRRVRKLVQGAGKKLRRYLCLED